MQNLITASSQVLEEKIPLPFSIYQSIKEQHIFNVPIVKPLLVFVLNGCKKLGEENEITCPAGSFVFLSNSPKINMRNIPDFESYFAILVEFDYSDFDAIKRHNLKTERYCTGKIDKTLEKALLQFIEWAPFAPPELWALRRKEILQLLLAQGYEQVVNMMEAPTLSNKLHTLISSDLPNDFDAKSLSSILAMSESTLRRKLNAEGSSLQEIKDKARLGHGLHLIQTSLIPIGHIAEQCGYQSQSRFTDKFKQLFGITPTELRKTRLQD